MNRRRTRRRTSILAKYLVVGTLILQLGSCMAMALNTGVTAFDVGTLLDENGLMFGGFAPCGRQNIQYVIGEGLPGAGQDTGGVLYTDDDMIWDCPVSRVEIDP